ncbi:18526_t:CDS:1, partial [Gigaspora rosea]
MQEGMQKGITQTTKNAQVLEKLRYTQWNQKTLIFQLATQTNVVNNIEQEAVVYSTIPNRVKILVITELWPSSTKNLITTLIYMAAV